MDNYTLYNTIALHSWIFIFHHSSALKPWNERGSSDYMIKINIVEIDDVIIFDLNLDVYGK